MPKRVERLIVEDCHRLNFTKDLYDQGIARLDRISLRMILPASSRFSMRPIALGGTSVALSPSSSWPSQYQFRGGA